MPPTRSSAPTFVAIEAGPFTPRGAIRLVVQILDPKEDERILDPACGTGGFLVATLAHMMNRFREAAKVAAGAETSEEFESLHTRLRKFAKNQLFGCDFDPFLVRASQMNMVMAGEFRMLRSVWMGTKLQDHHPIFAGCRSHILKSDPGGVHQLIVDAYRRRTQ